MTTSIVFDASLNCTGNISYKASTDVDFTDDWLTDPSASIIALQGLRYLKTRETTNEIVTPDITGRGIRDCVTFTNFTYDDYKMRRKAEVLKYPNADRNNTKQSYSYYARNKVTAFKKLSNTRLKTLRDTNACADQPEVLKLGYQAGIYGDTTVLYVDNGVPYHDGL